VDGRVDGWARESRGVRARALAAADGKQLWLLSRICFQLSPSCVPNCFSLAPPAAQPPQLFIPNQPSPRAAQQGRPPQKKTSKHPPFGRTPPSCQRRCAAGRRSHIGTCCPAAARAAHPRRRGPCVAVAAAIVSAARAHGIWKCCGCDAAPATCCCWAGESAARNGACCTCAAPALHLQHQHTPHPQCSRSAHLTWSTWPSPSVITQCRDLSITVALLSLTMVTW